ncbi:unnamed protein product, partial [Ectocarpus sp. 12 AP-2014]
MTQNGGRHKLRSAPSGNLRGCPLSWSSSTWCSKWNRGTLNATAEKRAGHGRGVESESLRTWKAAEHGPMSSCSKKRFAWLASCTHPSPTLPGNGARRSSRGWGRWRISWQRTRIIGISSPAQQRTPRMGSPELPSSSRSASAGSPRGPLPASDNGTVRAVGEGEGVSRCFVFCFLNESMPHGHCLQSPSRANICPGVCECD